MVPKAIKAFPDKELIQYRGKAEVVSGNTVGCSLELLELCPGEARRKVLLNSKEHTTVLPDTTSASPRY